MPILDKDFRTGAPVALFFKYVFGCLGVRFFFPVIIHSDMESTVDSCKF